MFFPMKIVLRRETFPADGMLDGNTTQTYFTLVFFWRTLSISYVSPAKKGRRDFHWIRESP